MGALCPIVRNALWALDFAFDYTIDRRRVKMLNVIEEFTRGYLAIRVELPIGAEMVVAVLGRPAVEV